MYIVCVLFPITIIYDCIIVNSLWNIIAMYWRGIIIGSEIIVQSNDYKTGAPCVWVLSVGVECGC